MIRNGQRFKSIKGGDSCAYMWKANYKPKEFLTVAQRRQRHQSNHPNDKNVKTSQKGVTWSKKTERDKKLEEFHQNHIWTYTDMTLKKKWVYIGSEEE